MRKELERRPLIAALAGLLIGVTAVQYPANLLFLIPLAIAFRSMETRLLASISLVIGLLIFRPPQILDPTQSKGTIDGFITSQPKPTLYGGQTCTLASDFGQVVLLADHTFELKRGEKISAYGEISPAETGPVSKPMFLKAYRVEQLSMPAAFLTWTQGWRNEFSNFAEKGLEKPEAQLLEAILFASPDKLSPDSKADFKAASGMQVLTAAGLHVLLIALAIQALMGLMPMPHWGQLLALAAVLCLFVVITGFQTSTIRASIFALVIRSAHLFRRESDALSAVSLTGILLLLFDPAEATHLGFQLTIVAAFAFALFKGNRPKMAKTARALILSKAKQGARMALLATLATAPILAQTQHMVVGQSVLASLLSTFVLAPILGLSLLFYGASYIGPTAAIWGLMTLVAPLLLWIEGVMHTLAQVTFLRLDVPYFSGYWLVLFYACLLAVWRPLVRRA